MTTKPPHQAPGDGFASEFIPAWAVTCWCDDDAVYTAIPTKAGPPLIQRYPLTEGGMTKAINILRVQRKAISKGRVHKESNPPITRFQKPKPLNDKDRAMALAILKKVGIL